MKCINILLEKETKNIATKLSKLVKKGDLIYLTGDLGAGKTLFTQAFAYGLGIREQITSPTFTIIKEYDGIIPLFHFDVYRIERLVQMDDLGYDEYFFGDGVCVIEWASIIEEILPDGLWVEINVVGEKERKICFKGTNKYYEKMVEELLK
ncbi:MAG: tRNA (adenosine(37)-N6)-threonylcarbamoyltransferase complex ATPase subunit type 1 TsaE [Alkaliphilus sp.]|nr:tRNA (adenosine(37)-N6)-threonylcarbamoyltransferase complex ATPase subunit type 1 TsaE [bacterium AH-315-L21]MBN4067568.1 tRNA (adenosine(37)-N6)-threonylcarbamoyltransferase complex ATPase subunit type 1 TsaE [Alkaliphilus transvaalensis]PHS33861.1 MAG: tRNA (adenosine(37)-N6)-threonylcarbamoyltransferase complex ATPase subunit type 1 TsaE [Alkaliphilus sp.]